MDAPLLCTVRGCDEPLQRCDRSLVCPRGHSFDVARSGYINLLQPQDRRSRRPGDARRAIEARAGLFKAGVGQSLTNAVVQELRALSLQGTPPLIVDLGSGSGDLLAHVAQSLSVAGIGIDLSTDAAELSARRFPSLTWVVANADRRLPVTSSSVGLVLSVHARRNPLECRRVLDPRGYLLIAVPAPDDLIELRAAVQGAGIPRDRADGVIAEHAGQFAVARRTTVRETVSLDGPLLRLLLDGTYRGARTGQPARAMTLDRLDVTLASDLLLFTAR